MTVKRFALGTALLLGLALPASGQVVTSTTGALNGTVTDNTKGVLPGVTVTIQSPQMMGTRDAVTDDQGRYQFAAIPPGTYAVTFSLPGFSTLIRENIRVSLGFTASVNVELQLATQQETITVTGESPVVDTQSTNITNNFDAQAIADLPTARDFPSLMAETPGVSMTRIDVGGSAAMSETGYTVYGMSSGGNQLSIEGTQVNNIYYPDFGSFAEVQISTAAHTAEMAVPGVMTNMISHSGGNTYHGTFYADYEKDEWGSRNIDQRQLDLGVTGGFGLDARDTNRVDDYKDINGGAGGFILKDKIWWYGSIRHNASNVRFVNFPVKPQYTRLTNRNLKVTYNLTPNNKFIGYYNYVFKYQPERFVVKEQIHYSLDEPWDEDFPTGSWKTEYNSVLSQAAFLEMRVGDSLYDFYNFSRAPDKPLYIDSVTSERFGGSEANLRHLRRPQWNGSLSYFKNGWGNSHTLKFGWEVARDYHQYDRYGRFGRDMSGTPPLDIDHRIRNGVPNQVTLYESSSASKNFLWTYSSYINDTWQLNNYLSFNLGIRFDRYRAGSPEQVHPVSVFNPTEDRFAAIDEAFSFNGWGPRLGIVWNVKGDGKTVVKANWGSYPWRPNPRGVDGQNPNPTNWFKRYVWTDRNGDRLWQPGEEGRLVTEQGATTQRIDPNWKNNVTKELAVWLERELMPSFGVRSGVVWRGDKQQQVTLNPNRPIETYNVAKAVRDPGPDGRLGTADDGASFQVFDLNPANLALPILNMTTHNPYVDGDDHYTWEITGVKRMTWWSLNTSFAHTWSRQTPNQTNPNGFINTQSDRRNHYTDWQAKLAGTFRLPKDVKLSPVWRHQSGDAFARTFEITLDYGNQVIRSEPVGTRRVDNVNLVDVRAEKGFKFGGDRRVAFFLDVFNILNANPAEDIVQTSGARFLRPIIIVGPRVARIGTKFEW
jgi:hypothetical protein